MPMSSDILQMSFLTSVGRGVAILCHCQVPAPWISRRVSWTSWKWTKSTLSHTWLANPISKTLLENGWSFENWFPGIRGVVCDIPCQKKMEFPWRYVLSSISIHSLWCSLIRLQTCLPSIATFASLDVLIPKPPSFLSLASHRYPGWSILHGINWDWV